MNISPCVTTTPGLKCYKKIAGLFECSRVASCKTSKAIHSFILNILIKSKDIDVDTIKMIKQSLVQVEQ